MTRVSFIVIAYNEARVIREALEAIVAQEGLPDYELIVVNDGSRDATLAVVQEFAVSYAQARVIDLQPNRGRGAARAAGLAAATGMYVAFVDADIILPADWLQRCMPYMKTHDACGGTAVPDGDVSFVHRLFRLEPKVAAHTITVSGGNGLYKREVFAKATFNPDKKEGEDVALNRQFDAHGIRTVSVPGLVVQHREHKTYARSLHWLFVSGRSASRQFFEHRKVRLPDVAFAGFIGSVAAAGAAGMLGIAWWVAVLTVTAYVSLGSALHLRGKFYLGRTPCMSVLGILVNNTLLLAYYAGRTAGLVTQRRKHA